MTDAVGDGSNRWRTFGERTIYDNPWAWLGQVDVELPDGERFCAGTIPGEVTTDRGPAYRRVLDELIPSAMHTVERYANNPVEADHGRLKARLRPMRGLKRRRSADHLRRSRVRPEPATRPLRTRHRRPARHRIRTAFDHLATTI